jgi:signal transduction histidine kinase
LSNHIAIFSNDEALIHLLRETVAETLGSAFLAEAGAPDGLPAADCCLCIWDYVPGETVVRPGTDGNHWRKHLFLVDRQDLDDLKKLTNIADPNMLVKPVTRAALQAFLEGYGPLLNGQADDAGRRASTLRFERDEMLQILIQTNLKLQEYNQERNNFLTRSLHEFRAPLTAVSGYCELLLEEALDPLTPEQREILERMQQSVKRLTRATNSMFQLSVSDHARQYLNLERADIRDSIGQALQELSPVLENKRIPVTVEVDASPDGLLFEKSQIEQMLVNLLENACQFTPRGEAIEIKGYPFFWERRSGRASSFTHLQDRRVKHSTPINSFRVDIRDSGPGVPPLNAERIFAEHTSYAGGQDRSGAGLGLAICRMILSQHGGRVWAESSTAGGIFSFVLPLQPENAASRWETASRRAIQPRFVEN